MKRANFVSCARPVVSFQFSVSREDKFSSVSVQFRWMEKYLGVESIFIPAITFRTIFRSVPTKLDRVSRPLAELRKKKEKRRESVEKRDR